MKHIIGWVLTSIICFWVSALSASSPLPADQAFVLSASLNQNHEVVFNWDIAPGYYLYHDKMSFVPVQGKALLAGTIKLPKGESHRDAVHGRYQVHAGSLTASVALKNLAKGVLRLDIRYQGCSKAGFCYTPIYKTLNVNLSQVKGPALLDAYLSPTNEVLLNNPSEDRLTHFMTGNRFLMVLGFLGVGMLLSFTPCVLPMVPILSAIIVGSRRRSGAEGKKSRLFFLSLAYVAGMASMYALAGILVAVLGRNVQTALQQPWAMIFFGGILILLALSLFGLYELHLPKAWQRRIGRMTGRQKGGTIVGVFMMGCLSTLIVSPCVSAPLVAVLGFIGQTGDVWLGLLALSSIGIGMGVPLLLIGASAGKLLPRTGPWMTGIERFFGVLLLVMAVWMFSRGLPHAKGENANALFTSVSSPAAMDHALQQARRVKQPVILDFYANWCVPCQRMDKQVFSRADVREALQSFMRLRVDLTHNPVWADRVLQRFQQVGPPAMIFFDCDGRLLTSFSLTGETDSARLLATVQNTEQRRSCQKTK